MGFDKYGSGETFESCDKFGSGGALYHVPDSVVERKEYITYEQACERLQKAITEAFEPVIVECARITKNIIDAVIPTINPLMDEIKRMMDLILESYPDKRIVWLALHHKKERVRKKNRNRILKWIEKGGHI